VQALITVRNGAAAPQSASVRTSTAYNDGRWHHAVLRRGGGLLSLSVDGTAVTTADRPGSVSRNSPFGVHLGQRVDSRAFLTGALDEVRVWDRALTDGELTDPDVLGSAQDTVLWLPLDRVRG
jgi:sialidase-1